MAGLQGLVDQHSNIQEQLQRELEAHKELCLKLDKQKELLKQQLLDRHNVTDQVQK